MKRRLVSGGTPGLPSPGPSGDVPTRVGESHIDINSDIVDIPLPAGTADGDLLLMILGFRGINGTPLLSGVTGWTNVINLTRQSGTGSQAGRLLIYYKFASSEANPHTVQFAAVAANIGALLAYRNVDPTTPIAASATNIGGTSSSATHTTPSVVPAIPKCAVAHIALSAVASGVITWTWVGGSTELFDVAVDYPALTSGMSVATESTAVAGPTGTRVATSSQTSTWATATIALGPLP